MLMIGLLLQREMEGTVFTASLEGMKHVKSPEGQMLTKPFLDVCKQILPVIGAFSLSRSFLLFLFSTQFLSHII